MSAIERVIEVNPENLWRLETPGAAGWGRTAHPGKQAQKKYFMVSCDTHLQPPPKLFVEKIDPKYKDQLARIETRDGVRYIVTSTGRADRLVDSEMFGEDAVRSKAGAAFRSELDSVDFSPLDQRIADQQLDGIDAEVIFPNGPALMVWASFDPGFVAAQCRIWNDWAIDYCRPQLWRSSPVACIPGLDVDLAVAEVEHAAKIGFKILCLPNRPHYGPSEDTKPNWNHPDYDRLWAAIQDHDLPVTFHAGTGKDPRGSKGYGGAIINYVIHGCMEVIEPAVNLCASGIIERFPKLRFALVEGNGGWVPWMLDMMDEAHLKHHFWTRPRLKELPSTYFRTNGACAFGEDHSALLGIEQYNLQENMMWANDFPHHEGTWPHSAQAVERLFVNLKETTRANVLGLNAARFFGFDVPEALK